MTLFGICSKCGKKKLFTKIRTYIVPAHIPLGGPISSDTELCGSCYRAIKKVISTM